MTQDGGRPCQKDDPNDEKARTLSHILSAPPPGRGGALEIEFNLVVNQPFQDNKMPIKTLAEALVSFPG